MGLIRDARNKEKGLDIPIASRRNVFCRLLGEEAVRCCASPFTIVLLFVSVNAVESATAQTITPSMVESQMKVWLAAWASNDPEVIVRVDPPSNGFGAGALQLRPADTASGSE